ncbi:glucose 1-dehydrogenase [Erythrobacter dokdonensis]|uniref:Oxidoreductase, short chain dehydrogenase n=1 Tax=Erythrobacter dokdonensis DSW-74 TaxID=1300349 RepID=A0A1A7BLS9_9SPHN|nr:glucose 1-dehydrogenase [Erythrobacter dokdonensis]OBV12120.1 Oxidoreductase, short chain dehydrogenase [Erythrobacter dokdonensis DSW-74]
MAGRVEGKVVLLTGGAMGLGKASAKALLAEGARVIITDIDEAAGRATASELGCGFLPQDVTDWTRWQAIIAEVEQAHGRLDVLVNNAAITVFGSVMDISPEDFRRCYTVDVDSIFMGCKAAIPLMARHKEWDGGGGSIVNFSSAAGNKPSPDLAAYNSAKAAVAMLTKSIALWCAREQNGIRVNSVQPGTILTPNVESVIQGTPDPEATRAAFSVAQPIGRMGEVDDIAHLVVYLASDESRFATGAPFIVDGGLSIA